MGCSSSASTAISPPTRRARSSTRASRCSCRSRTCFGRASVPVFSDKHLSYNFAKARRMAEISRELGFPLMAGSSVPVAYRDPQIDLPYGAKVRHAVSVAYGGQDVYGFHLLECLQCLVERR